MSVAMPTEAPLSLADILSFKHGIKRPQLVGIIAGCAVFLVTIVTGTPYRSLTHSHTHSLTHLVFILLWKSGTLHKFAKEMQEESGNRKKKGVEEDDRAEDVDVLQQLAARPQLHDHLVRASKTLPMKPNINGKELAGYSLNHSFTDSFTYSLLQGRYVSYVSIMTQATWIISSRLATGHRYSANRHIPLPNYFIG